MSTHTSHSVRVTAQRLQATATPDPFPVLDGFEVEASGGIPPYTFTAADAPPNPPGVVVTQTGNNRCSVSVPPGTPPGTTVIVKVTDSSHNPKTVEASSDVA